MPKIENIRENVNIHCPANMPYFPTFSQPKSVPSAISGLSQVYARKKEGVGASGGAEPGSTTASGAPKSQVQAIDRFRKRNLNKADGI
jgi:hypothetical protein|tara:strand:+ start:593 stop:856 length:264 start_codon:yes stop_codon:yes gene_type:complete